MKKIERNRRYDIDWLRVIAIGLLLIYHIGIGFQPWGILIMFIQNNDPLNSLWAPMSMLNVWRIPLLFFVSGMGVSFAIGKRNFKQLILERAKRILIPLIFGALFIVPVHILIWQNYYGLNLSYTPGRGHLWFLANIFIYVTILSPLFFYLKRNQKGKMVKALKWIYGNPVGLFTVALFFVLETLLLKPQFYTLYAFTLHGFVLGFIAFLFGFTFVISGKAFWDTVLKWRWFYFVLSSSSFIVRLTIYKLEAPNYIAAIESVLWVFTAFGFAYKYLNRPSNTLSYLSQAAYPVYIVHMIFLYLASLLVFPLDISTISKLIFTILITYTGSFGLYQLVIRKINFIRPLFGLKTLNKQINQD